jgi:hypothetical protein
LYHDTLRKIRLRDHNRPEVLQHLHDHRILLGGLEGTTNVAQGAIIARDIELVFDRDWDAMERAFGLFGGLEFSIQFSGLLQGVVEYYFGDCIRLVLRKLV